MPISFILQALAAAGERQVALQSYTGQTVVGVTDAFTHSTITEAVGEKWRLGLACTR